MTDHGTSFNGSCVCMAGDVISCGMHINILVDFFFVSHKFWDPPKDWHSLWYVCNLRSVSERADDFISEEGPILWTY